MNDKAHSPRFSVSSLDRLHGVTERYYLPTAEEAHRTACLVSQPQRAGMARITVGGKLIALYADGKQVWPEVKP